MFLIPKNKLDKFEPLRCCFVLNEFSAAEFASALEMLFAAKKVNDLKLQNRLGNTSNSPRWATAYKFSSEKAVSKIKNIAIQTAIQSISEYQELNNMTGAVHGAAWCDLEGNILSIREDVGRHNALDKLIGHIIKQEVEKLGFITVTSRASFEMVNKVAISKVPLLVAVSAPTSMAVDTAKMCGVSLIAFARPNRHVIYNNNLNIIDEDN